MNQRDGFATGFFAGAVFGGVVGGILGAVIASRRDEELPEDEKDLINGSGESKKVSSKRRQMLSSDEDNQDMELARRSLEDKIAQLNATIDDVRKHLGNVNGSPSQSSGDRSLNKDA
ncbi:hypothetical protein [Anabaena azotica]|uniref:Gas vesicle protein n=1 Tax=Anabaena azotica FACHB-119 TaxID=947527 RepID=A0ABR8D727_9NOST|nr:hypothetical protein [Anabaena azotica]MBD2502692.1 hypothetical protein [Anabaena azotica FACHB-119]